MKPKFNCVQWFAWSCIVVSFTIMLMLAFSGCATQKRCNEKFPPEVKTETIHTKEIIRKDSILPGATIVNTIYKDSVQFYPVNQWRIIKDTSGLAELRYYKDAYGNIQVQCEATSRMVEKMLEMRSESQNTTKERVKLERKTPVWNWILIGALLITIIYLFLKSISGPLRFL